MATCRRLLVRRQTLSPPHPPSARRDEPDDSLGGTWARPQTVYLLARLSSWELELPFRFRAQLESEIVIQEEMGIVAQEPMRLPIRLDVFPLCIASRGISVLT